MEYRCKGTGFTFDGSEIPHERYIIETVNRLIGHGYVIQKIEVIRRKPSTGNGFDITDIHYREA